MQCYSFIEGNTKWTIRFSRGFISVSNESSINIQLNYIENEIVRYEQDTQYSNGAMNVWGSFITRGFTFTPSTRSYINDIPPTGEIDIYINATEFSGGHSIVFAVPYLVANAFMSLMNGNTHVEGAITDD